MLVDGNVINKDNPALSGLLRLVRTVDLTMPMLAHDSLKLYSPEYLQMQHLAGVFTNPTPLQILPTARRARTNAASTFENLVQVP